MSCGGNPWIGGADRCRRWADIASAATAGDRWRPAHQLRMIQAAVGRIITTGGGWHMVTLLFLFCMLAAWFIKWQWLRQLGQLTAGRRRLRSNSKSIKAKNALLGKKKTDNAFFANKYSTLLCQNHKFIFLSMHNFCYNNEIDI
jgi:hypothetical protein